MKCSFCDSDNRFVFLKKDNSIAICDKCISYCTGVIIGIASGLIEKEQIQNVKIETNIESK